MGLRILALASARDSQCESRVIPCGKRPTKLLNDANFPFRLQASASRDTAGDHARAVMTGPGKIEVRPAPVPNPSLGELRVRMEGCGLCASNLAVWAGAPWFTYPLEPGAPGHEAFGWIDLAGPEVTGWQRGQRVAFLSSHGFAEYDLARADSTVLLPAELEGVPFPGEPLGCAMNIFRRSNVHQGDTVAIVGIGFLGALLVQLCAHAGARVIALARSAEALHLANSLGASEGSVTGGCAGRDWPDTRINRRPFLRCNSGGRRQTSGPGYRGRNYPGARPDGDRGLPSGWAATREYAALELAGIWTSSTRMNGTQAFTFPAFVRRCSR